MVAWLTQLADSTPADRQRDQNGFLSASVAQAPASVAVVDRFHVRSDSTDPNQAQKPPGTAPGADGSIIFHKTVPALDAPRRWRARRWLSFLGTRRKARLALSRREPECVKLIITMGLTRTA